MKKEPAVQHGTNRNRVMPHLLCCGLLLCLLACSDQPTNASGQAEIGDLPTACMERIIALDDSLGSLRNHQCEQVSLDQTIANYAEGLEALDFSGCPPEFVSAFTSHIRAWRDMQPVAAQFPGLRGEMHDLFDQIALSPDSTVFQSRLDRIWSTWAEIEAAMKEVE